MTKYSLIIDGLTALIGFLIIYNGYKKGFIRSVILVIGYVFSIFFSVYLSKIVSVYLYDNFIRELIINNIDKTIASTAGQLSVSELVPVVLSKLPKVIINPLIGDSGGLTHLNQLIVSQTDGTLTKLSQVIVDNIFSPIILQLMKVVLCLIIFILCTIIVKIIAKMFRGIYGIPIIGSINAVLGALLGIVQAAISFYLIALIISIIISLTANELPWINNEVMNSTYILRHFLH